METLTRLPTPNWQVEQIVEGRKHLYKVTEDDGRVSKFPGVTGRLQIIAKPALYNWYAKQATENAERALMAQLGGKKSKKITLTEDWVKAIIAESKKKPEKLKDEAAELGTLAHQYFEDYCFGRAPSIENVLPAIRPSIERFLKWVNESGLTIVAGDTKVASLRYGYGGALDCILQVVDESKMPAELGLSNGEYVLGDYKSSNGVYDEYALQVSAYDQAFIETYGVDCRAALIIRFGKDQKKDEAGNPLPLDFESKWLKDPKRSFAAFLGAATLQDAMKESHFLGE